MDKVLKRIILIICIFISILLISSFSQASGGLYLKNLDYDVTLNSDGTADVVETWRIRISDTNTLFKNFEVDSTKYKEITNVKVQEIKSSGIVDFTKINQYKYHVDKNCYYALMYNGKFEIAWGAHAEDTTRTYKISYKIVDAVKNYKDCSEFYWQFINRTSEIPADKIVGTIKLPKEIQNKEDLKAWAHGPLNGNIEITSNNTVTFEVEDFNERTMLEARIVTPVEIFSNNLNTSNANKLNSILSQEQTWADQANDQRKRIAQQQEEMKRAFITALIVVNVIGLIIAIAIIRKIVKYHKELKNTPIIKPEQEFDYYRDIPDELETPAGAGYLYYFKRAEFQYNISKIISATMLDLCLKKYIEFETIQDKKNQIKINLKKENAQDLPVDERIIYELLNHVPKGEQKCFTMKEFEKYASDHSTTFLHTFRIIEKKVKEKEEEQGNYSEELIEEANKWRLKGTGYLFLSIFALIAWLAIIPSIIATIYCFKIASRYNRLTQKGINEKAKWTGLKKYMEEFSMMNDKTVPELVLWEKYLVYATAFGIADKVLKQLKVVYPQITDIDYMNSHGYTYMYLMYSHNFSNSFISSLNNAVNVSYHRTYSSNYSTNYSSGSGGGGGFSSGGGFGGGGGRNGRKIIYFQNDLKQKL